MKLLTRIFVYKNKLCLVTRITINFGGNLALSFIPRPFLSFNKFKREPRRIIREINKGILQYNNPDFSYSEINVNYKIYNYWIDYADLSKLKLQKDLRKKVNEVLEGYIKKKYVKKPSREKSQMEYRKRAYYGKCKRK